tara:strand:- start:1038 stop:1652 length:615 start_codon:yes stop_codon:yes gene_type:complete
MAKDKKSVLLYCDIIHTVEKLSNEQAGELFKHYLRYVNDMKPVAENPLTEIVFEPIRQSLKRDLIKYGNIVDRNKKNGAKGGRPSKPKEPNGLIGNPKEPKKPDSDSDIDSDKGIGIKQSVFPFSDFWTLYPKKVGLKDCEKKYNKISEVNRGLIKNTLNNFIKHKPFESYTHPNPSTYLNQERWNDVLTPVVKSSNAFVMDKF